MVLTKDILYPHLDGRVYKEAISLTKHGFDVSVLCRIYSFKDVPRTENYDGITIIRHLCELPKFKYKSRIKQLYQNFKNARNMANKIVQIKPDIIHAHDLNALLECVLAKRKLGIPLIYDSHEDWPRFEQSNGNNIAYLGALLYENFLLTHVNFVITVNHILGQKFKQKRSTIILYNLPEEKKFKAKPDIVKQIRKKYKLQHNIVIEYHGVIGRTRGIDKFIDAASKLVRRFDNIRFLIIGPGYEDLVNEVNRKIEEIKFKYPNPPKKQKSNQQQRIVKKKKKKQK